MDPYGELVDDNTVRFERLLPGPIERVWQYLVDGDKRREWLCAGDFASEEGAAIELRFHNARLSGDDDIDPPEKYANLNGEIVMTGRILEYDEPRVLAHSWVFNGEDSVVRYELEAQRDGVRLTLTHSRLPGKESVLSVSGGWHTHLALLEAILGEKNLPPFWATQSPLEAEYRERFGF